MGGSTVLSQGFSTPSDMVPGVPYTGAAAEGGQGVPSPPQYSSKEALPPNKIAAMTTECVLLLLHALNAFQNAVYSQLLHVYRI